MSSAADPSNFTSAASRSERAIDGGQKALRIIQSVVGVTLFLGALGLWFAPGANWSGDLMLFKLLISAVSGMAGLALLQGHARNPAPNVEIDTIRHEVRLVRTKGKDRWVLDRCKFAELSRVVDTGAHLQLWGKQNALLAEVAAADRVSHRSLTTALRVAGKL